MVNGGVRPTFWVAVIAVALAAYLAAYTNRVAVPLPRRPLNVSVILCADNGTFSGSHELTNIIAVLNDTREVVIDDCQKAWLGYMNGKAVLAVTTGIYFINAAVCTASILESTEFHMTEGIFLGTAGFSPVEGGWDPSAEGGCEVLSNPVKNAIGSVCVTDSALLLECGICIEGDISTECSRPNCKMHSDNSFFGKCSFRHPTSLVSKVRGAMSERDFSSMPPEVQLLSERFWGAHEAVSDRSAPLRPRFVNCAETTNNQILAGARADVLCREYAHAVVPETSVAQQTCVQAMESFGFLHAMSHYPEIPVAVVRAASNYDMYPMRAIYNTTEGSAAVRWDQNVKFMDDEEYVTLTKAAYRYAVQTSGELVVAFLRKHTAGF